MKETGMRTIAASVVTGLGFVCMGIACGGDDGGQAGGTSSGSSVTAATTSGPPPTPTTVEDPTKEQAITVVTKLIKVHATACQAENIKVLSAERVPGAGFWRVRVKLTTQPDDFSGTATWTVEQGEPVANDDYAGAIERDCAPGGF
jgi:hypothetical protein